MENEITLTQIETGRSAEQSLIRGAKIFLDLSDEEYKCYLLYLAIK